MQNPSQEPNSLHHIVKFEIITTSETCFQENASTRARSFYVGNIVCVECHTIALRSEPYFGCKGEPALNVLGKWEDMSSNNCERYWKRISDPDFYRNYSIYNAPGFFL